MLNTITI